MALIILGCTSEMCQVTNNPPPCQNLLMKMADEGQFSVRYPTNTAAASVLPCVCLSYCFTQLSVPSESLQLPAPRQRERSPSPLRGYLIPSPLPTRRNRTRSAYAYTHTHKHQLSWLALAIIGKNL